MEFWPRWGDGSGSLWHDFYSNTRADTLFPCQQGAAVGRAEMKKSPSQILMTTIHYLICILLAIVFVGPFVWMLSSSLKPHSEIFASPPSLLSSNFSFTNFEEVFRQAPFERYML